MFIKFTLVLITIILLVNLAGCGTTNQANTTPNEASNTGQSNASGVYTNTAPTDSYQMLPKFSGQMANFKLDASANGSTQQLKKGEVISISLESNPSTGYSWYASISNKDVLMQMGEPEYQAPAESSTPMVGAPGTQTFYYQAASTGTATLTLEYKRGWETDVAPVQTVAITVEVK